VTANVVVVTIEISHAGTVAIAGPGLKTAVKPLPAGTHRVNVALTSTGRTERKHGVKIKLAVSLKTGGRTVTSSKKIKL
jgi:hypothetical protein